MPPVIIEGILKDELAGALLRVVSHPEERARLHTLLGGFCHQCRNNLNSLKLSLYLAKQASPPQAEPLWSELQPCYEDLEELVERIQFILRPLRLVTVRMLLSVLMDDRVEAWLRKMATHGRRLEFDPPSREEPVPFDPQRLSEALDSLVDWRAESGDPSVPARLRWWTEGGEAHLDWEETGSSTRCEGVTALGSLALPFLARVASALGGVISIDARDGLHVSVCWPAAPSCPLVEQP